MTGSLQSSLSFIAESMQSRMFHSILELFVINTPDWLEISDTCFNFVTRRIIWSCNSNGLACFYLVVFYFEILSCILLNSVSFFISYFGQQLSILWHVDVNLTLLKYCRL